MIIPEGERQPKLAPGWKREWMSNIISPGLEKLLDTEIVLQDIDLGPINNNVKSGDKPAMDYMAEKIIDLCEDIYYPPTPPVVEEIILH